MKNQFVALANPDSSSSMENALLVILDSDVSSVILKIELDV